MTMEYNQWKEILSAVNADKNLSKDNVIEKVKERLKVEDKDKYEKWEKAGFNINHRFAVGVLYRKGPRPLADLDLKIYKHTLLDLAAKNGYRKLADSLLKIAEINFEAVDEDGKTPAHWAALSGHEEIVNILIEAGIDISTVDKSGWTLLHWAANEGHAEVVEVLLNRGADVNAIVAGYGWTPLHWAAYNSHIQVVNVLIKAGAGVNAANENGETPLHCAAAKFNEEVIKILIKEGAKINAVNKDGETPLYFAATGCLNEHILSVLIKNGANINLADKNGRTPLHAAAQGCFNTRIIDILMENGADYSLKDENGKTPMDLDERGYIRQLLEKKAKKNGLYAGGTSALLGTAAAVALFATGAVAVELISIVIAVAAIATTALVVGGITYMMLKPSTKMDGVNGQGLEGNERKI